MACRWGTETSVGRCYKLWMNYSECITSAEVPTQCVTMREDYFECLHGNRQTTHVNEMQMERKRRIAAGLPVPTTVEEDLASGKLPARLGL
mmetsp:Transcript_18227/g.49043  ORF Transcript_18227/g.49043 Transcript_18227/m.49043 type:complete len:91 (+) Transcript_18227:76-348(+)